MRLRTAIDRNAKPFYALLEGKQVDIEIDITADDLIKYIENQPKKKEQRLKQVEAKPSKLKVTTNQGLNLLFEKYPNLNKLNIHRQKNFILYNRGNINICYNVDFNQIYANSFVS